MVVMKKIYFPCIWVTKKVIMVFRQGAHDTIRHGLSRGMLQWYDADENKFSDKEQAACSEI
jgi:hypothetical protein